MLQIIKTFSFATERNRNCYNRRFMSIKIPLSTMILIWWCRRKLRSVLRVSQPPCARGFLTFSQAV